VSNQDDNRCTCIFQVLDLGFCCLLLISVGGTFIRIGTVDGLVLDIDLNDSYLLSSGY
jgi:hypothetical protein